MFVFIKHSYNMPKVRTMFCDSQDNNTVEIFHNTKNEITVWVEDPNRIPISVSLDKSTAIKMTRILKREIAKINEGGQNG